LQAILILAGWCLSKLKAIRRSNAKFSAPPRAYAPPLLQNAVAPQDFFEKIGVQGGGEAFFGNAILGRMSLQQAELETAEQSQVLGGIPLLYPVVILSEVHVEAIGLRQLLPPTHPVASTRSGLRQALIVERAA